jgi:hypothetical protein
VRRPADYLSKDGDVAPDGVEARGLPGRSSPTPDTRVGRGRHRPPLERATDVPCRQACWICELAARRAATAAGASRSSAASRAVAYLDDKVIALLEDRQVLVAPCEHLDRLPSTPAAAGVVLAVLRRAVSTIQSSCGTSGATIELVTEVDGAAGHVCYRIVPTAAPPREPGAIDGRELAAALSGVGAGPS